MVDNCESQIINVGYSADCVEYCPIQTSGEWLVCGTYQVESLESTSEERNYQRLGCIYLYQIVDGRLFVAPIEYLNHIRVQKQRLQTAAVLDIKWYARVLLDPANPWLQGLYGEYSRTYSCTFQCTRTNTNFEIKRWQCAGHKADIAGGEHGSRDRNQLSRREDSFAFVRLVSQSR